MMNDVPVCEDGQVRQKPRDLERLAFEVKPVPPFCLELTVQALRRRAVNAIDRWDGTTYRRVLKVQGRPLGIEVVQLGPPEFLLLRVAVSGRCLPPGTRPAVMAALTRLLGLDRCLGAFYQAAEHDPLLGPLAREFHGLKPPRFATLFETWSMPSPASR